MTGMFVRCFSYLLVVVALAEGLRLEAVILDRTRAYSEFGYTEWAQSAIRLIRENDQTLELFLPHGSWKYFASAVFLALVAYFVRRRSLVIEQFGHLPSR